MKYFVQEVLSEGALETSGVLCDSFVQACLKLP